MGFVDGRNVAIEYRWAEGQYERLPAMASDLVQRQVSVIAAATTPAVLAAKAATSTTPIVFVTIGNPVQMGLVASLNRPGGNLTGVNSMSNELAAKRLGLLYELLPQAARFAVLANPDNPTTAPLNSDVQAAAAAIGRQVDHPEAEAIFLSGVGMPTLDALRPLEDDTGKPVISAASAMMWHALRTAGVNTKV